MLRKELWPNPSIKRDALKRAPYVKRYPARRSAMPAVQPSFTLPPCQRLFVTAPSLAALTTLRLRYTSMTFTSIQRVRCSGSLIERVHFCARNT